jgi:hypothetical protein
MYKQRQIVTEIDRKTEDGDKETEGMEERWRLI